MTLDEAKYSKITELFMKYNAIINNGMDITVSGVNYYVDGADGLSKMNMQVQANTLMGRPSCTYINMSTGDAEELSLNTFNNIIGTALVTVNTLYENTLIPKIYEINDIVVDPSGLYTTEESAINAINNISLYA